jgi:hypothetical protein
MESVLVLEVLGAQYNKRAIEFYESFGFARTTGLV